MLTIFTTAKAFRGHFNVIQRNALKSWVLLHPDVEVILFGDEEGYAEAARDIGLRHEPGVRRNQFGTILVSSMFEKAQALSKHNLLCYVNCDIVLFPDFLAALQTVREKGQPFLLVGRRWDVEVTQPLPFERPAWALDLRELALHKGRRRTPDWIDYFAFSRGVYASGVPDFAVGRTFWDNWLLWKATALGHIVVDASPVVVAVHQNHDYSHHSGGIKGVWRGEESARNLALTGGPHHLHTIAFAPFRLTKSGIKSNWPHKLALAWWKAGLAFDQALIAWQNLFWHPLLNATRPVRSALGLRKADPRLARKP